jgi:hypothetical protein
MIKESSLELQHSRPNVEQGLRALELQERCMEYSSERVNVPSLLLGQLLQQQWLLQQRVASA